MDINLTYDGFDMRHDVLVDCIDTNTPYTDEAKTFIEASLRLPNTPFAFSIKTSVCYDVRYATEKILDGEENPIPKFIDVLKRNTQILEAAVQDIRFTELDEEVFESLEKKTGDHYGNLFKEFDSFHYYNETYDLLKTRFERNGFDFS